jgi:hypothetical protein
VIFNGWLVSIGTFKHSWSCPISTWEEWLWWIHPEKAGKTRGNRDLGGESIAAGRHGIFLHFCFSGFTPRIFCNVLSTDWTVTAIQYGHFLGSIWWFHSNFLANIPRKKEETHVGMFIYAIFWVKTVKAVLSRFEGRMWSGHVVNELVLQGKYIYIYIYICSCICIYIYIYIYLFI